MTTISEPKLFLHLLISITLIYTPSTLSVLTSSITAADATTTDTHERLRDAEAEIANLRRLIADEHRFNERPRREGDFPGLVRRGNHSPHPGAQARRGSRMCLGAPVGHSGAVWPRK